jgi:prepilin-type N-terminal cleavage/methylation domain-containing protein
MKNSRTQGFTLIEIAIVLVIIGLLLGGILKGQELITSARVRNLISQQDGIKAAFFGFQDRYRALPGDYSSAATNIQLITTGTAGNGNGDGRITIGGTPDESILAWEHLARSGFINGNYVYGTGTVTDLTTPKNPYGQFLQMAWDNTYAVSAGTPINRHNLKTGPQIPVEIVSEVDRKVDDGVGNTGSFVFSEYAGTGTAPIVPGTPPACMATAGTWNLTGGTTAVNCGAATLM